MGSYDDALELVRAGLADIDYENSDPFLLASLGISRTPIYGYRNVPQPDGGDVEVSDGDEGGVIKIATVNERYFQGWVYHEGG